MKIMIICLLLVSHLNLFKNANAVELVQHIISDLAPIKRGPTKQAPTKQVSKSTLSLAPISKTSSATATMSTATISLSPFSIKTHEQLNQKYLGKKWLLVLWSVDCPPCFEELKIISQFKKNNKENIIILLNTDIADIDTEILKDIINQFELTDSPHYYYAAVNPSKLSHSIDPDWSGELPRSYWFDNQATRFGTSGLITINMLEQWFK